MEQESFKIGDYVRHDSINSGEKIRVCDYGAWKTEYRIHGEEPVIKGGIDSTFVICEWTDQDTGDRIEQQIPVDELTIDS